MKSCYEKVGCDAEGALTCCTTRKSHFHFLTFDILHIDPFQYKDRISRYRYFSYEDNYGRKTLLSLKCVSLYLSGAIIILRRLPGPIFIGQFQMISPRSQPVQLFKVLRMWHVRAWCFLSLVAILRVFYEAIYRTCTLVLISCFFYFILGYSEIYGDSVHRSAGLLGRTKQPVLVLRPQYEAPSAS